MQVRCQPLALQIMVDDVQVVEAHMDEARGRAGCLALALGGPRFLFGRTFPLKFDDPPIIVSLRYRNQHSA